MPEYKATPLRVLDQVMTMMVVVLMLMIKMMMLLLKMMMVVLMLMIKMMMLLLMMLVVLVLMIKMVMLLMLMIKKMMVVLMISLLMISLMISLLMMLVQLAGRLGIGKLWVKDESYRFNLKAFKVKTSCTNISSSCLGLSLCLFSLKVSGVLAYLDFVFGFVCVQVAP